MTGAERKGTKRFCLDAGVAHMYVLTQEGKLHFKGMVRYPSGWMWKAAGERENEVQLEGKKNRIVSVFAMDYLNAKKEK